MLSPQLTAEGVQRALNGGKPISIVSPYGDGQLASFDAKTLRKLLGTDAFVADDLPNLARAIVKRPDVLLCDEPTGALDFATGKRVLEAIADINQRLGTTSVVITHNAAIARMADRVLYLGDGCIQREERHAQRATAAEVAW